MSQQCTDTELKEHLADGQLDDPPSDSHWVQRVYQLGFSAGKLEGLRIAQSTLRAIGGLAEIPLREESNRPIDELLKTITEGAK